MLLLDRYILLRFTVNFAILFALLYVFSVAIDLVIALDHFVEGAQTLAGPDAGTWGTTLAFVHAVVNFQAPRIFQFYAYLHGLVAIGAMGFTLSQMCRYKELVAILASGISLHRVAMPFIVAVFGISIVQLLNQELLLPRVAPLLLRDHRQIGQQSIDQFPISLLPDGRSALLQAPTFDPATGVLTAPTILERDSRGRTVRRITAERATWQSDESLEETGAGWRLEGGESISLAAFSDPGAMAMLPVPIDFYATDLSPRLLLVHRHGQFASLLSLKQIRQMLDTRGVRDRSALRRYEYARFATVLVNVLVMWLALPTFLLREPANLLVRSLMCATVSIPAMTGAAIFMVMDLPGISPAVGVFLPALIMIPIVLAQWTYVRT